MNGPETSMTFPFPQGLVRILGPSESLRGRAHGRRVRGRRERRGRVAAARARPAAAEAHGDPHQHLCIAVRRGKL